MHGPDGVRGALWRDDEKRHVPSSGQFFWDATLGETDEVGTTFARTVEKQQKWPRWRDGGIGQRLEIRQVDRFGDGVSKRMWS